MGIQEKTWEFDVATYHIQSKYTTMTHALSYLSYVYALETKYEDFMCKIYWYIMAVCPELHVWNMDRDLPPIDSNCLGNHTIHGASGI